MKNRIHLLLQIVIWLLASASVNSQSIDKLVIGSQQDATYLVNGYVSPALSVIGYGLNQGWYNTAKPHKIAGIDITATINLINVPTSGKNYYVDNSRLNTIQLVTPNSNPNIAPVAASGYVPTVFGPNVTPTYQFKADNGTTNGTFTAVQGADLSKIPGGSLPVPIAQVGIGLPKGTDLKIRMLPKIKFGDNNGSDVSMFGIGIMHDLKQYVPGIKVLPFDLSAFVGYTNLKIDVAFDPKNNPNQMGTLTSTATTIQGVLSKKVSVLTGYVGVGYNFGNTKASVKGTYDLTGGTNYTTPININMSGTSTGPRATVGLRLKLAILTFHGEYTAQKYSSLTVGFGLSIR